jgi:carbonyl reductase 1
MIRAFAPLLAPDGMFLVVASDFGTLRNLPSPLHERFDADRISLDELDSVMTADAESVRRGRAAADGWPEHINIPSKVGQVAAAPVARAGRRGRRRARSRAGRSRPLRAARPARSGDPVEVIVKPREERRRANS